MVDQLQHLGLLHPPDIVADGLVVRDVSRRHRLHLIEGPLRVAVKEPGNEGPAHTLERERRVLEWVADGPARLGPRPLAWDPVGQVLVTELLDGETLADHRRRLGHVPRPSAALLGAALGELHAASTRLGIMADLPGILRIHRPSVSALGQSTQGQIELIRFVQGAPGACEALDAAARDWRATAVIHGDLRWENVILKPAEGSSEATVRLVDWESAGRGDPCWDVGSSLASILLDELALVPRAPATTWDLVAGADRALARARPSVAALWRGWADRTGLTGREAVKVRKRAARLAGARLVQFAAEIAGESGRGLELPAALPAQVGLDVMTRPQEAAEKLLELDDPAPPPFS